MHALAALVDVNNSLEVKLSVYVCQIIIANSKLLWLLDKQHKKELIPQRYLIDRVSRSKSIELI